MQRSLTIYCSHVPITNLMLFEMYECSYILRMYLFTHQKKLFIFQNVGFAAHLLMLVIFTLSLFLFLFSPLEYASMWTQKRTRARYDNKWISLSWQLSVTVVLLCMLYPSVCLCVSVRRNCGWPYDRWNWYSKSST